MHFHNIMSLVVSVYKTCISAHCIVLSTIFAKLVVLIEEKNDRTTIYHIL